MVKARVSPVASTSPSARSSSFVRIPKRMAKGALGRYTRVKNWVLSRHLRGYPSFSARELESAIKAGMLRQMSLATLPRTFNPKPGVELVVHPKLVPVMTIVATECEKAGLPRLSLTSVFRSTDKQLAIRQEGNVFAAAPQNSAHCKGLAFDVSVNNLDKGQKRSLVFILRALKKAGKLSYIDETLGNNCMHISIASK